MGRRAVASLGGVNLMPADDRFHLCVYCGSRAGADPRFAAAAERVGRLLGRRGAALVYGGGQVGLMGTVADATLASGGRVLGVIPRALVDRELAHRGLTDLQVVDTMHQRKLAMATQADAFLTLPGGIGTLEELFETWSWKHLGYHRKPIGLLNVAGFFDPLLAFIEKAASQGFVQATQQEQLLVDEDLDRLFDRLVAASAERSADYSAS